MNKENQTNHKILVAEDQLELFEIIETLLEGEGWIVEHAENGKIACELLQQKEYDLLLTDIRMPEMDGLELLAWCNQNHSVPVIIMTGFSDVSSTEQAKELGAVGFIPKPFELNELTESIRLALGNESKNVDPDYCGINIDNFLSRFKLLYNVYLRISSSKYLKIAHSSEALDPGRLDELKQKGVKRLFIKREDFKKYVGFSLSLSKSALKNPKASNEKKSKFIYNLGEALYQHSFVIGLDNESYNEAKEFVELAVSVLLEDENVFNSLQELGKVSNFLYAHSLATSVYSVLIAKKLEWDSPKTLFHVASAGLFHDLGKIQLKDDPFSNPNDDFSDIAPDLLISHAAKGAEMLSKVSSIPQEVVTIVRQHHEDCLGQGPEGLKMDEIQPLSRLVAVSNMFCNSIGFGKDQVLDPTTALERMAEFQDLYDPDCFIALIKIFNLNPTSVLKKRVA